MKVIGFWLLGIFLVLYPLASFAESIIFLKKNAWVRGVTIYLRDIAEVKGDPMKQIPLGPTPPIGCIAYWNRESIAAKLARNGIDLSQIRWQGSEEVEVETQSMVLNPCDMEILSREFLKLSLPWSESEMKCESIRIPRTPIHLPAPKSSLKIKPKLGNPGKKRGRLAVHLSIFIDGKRVHRLILLYRIRVFQNIWVTRSFLPRHTPLTKENTQQKRREITNLSSEPITSWIQLKGKRTKYSLPPNYILTMRAIEPIPLILKGERILILFESTNLQITVPAKALEDGKRGEVIRVMNLASHQILKAQVIDDSKVAIYLEK